MITYRHIFFKENIIQHGRGEIDVQYYGQLYPNAMKMKNFRDLYDKTLDLFVACNDCATAKYRNFTKVKPGQKQ